MRRASLPQLTAFCYFHSKGKESGKRFLVGYGEVDLDHTAMFCAMNHSPLSKRFKLLNSPTQGAVEAGLIHLTLKVRPHPLWPLATRIHAVKHPTMLITLCCWLVAGHRAVP